MTGSPRRLLLTTDAVGGVWQYSLDLAERAGRRGVETVLAILGPPPDRDRLADALALSGVRPVVTGLPLDWTADDPGEIEAAGRAVARLAAETGVGIVHLNSPALAAAAAFPAPVLAFCHSCVATWWGAVRGGAPLPPDFRWRADLVARGLARADAVVAPSAAFAEATARAHGLASRPSVVRNGRRLPPDPVPGPATGSPPAPFAFTAGRLWDEGKNLAMLDVAAGLMSLPVYAAGPVRGPNGAAASFRHANPLGPLADAEMRRWLGARPVFVSVARYEPFGLAVLEAAQAGCALVLADQPTFRELWEGAARFVPAGDPRAIAAAVEEVARDPARRSRLADAARDRARDYSIEAMADGTERIYRSVFEGRRAA